MKKITRFVEYSRRLELINARMQKTPNLKLFIYNEISYKKRQKIFKEHGDAISLATLSFYIISMVKSHWPGVFESTLRNLSELQKEGNSQIQLQEQS